MNLIHNIRAALAHRTAGMGPGTRSFFANLSIVTVFFALSKVFSSVSMIIVARFLGSIHLGAATMIMSIASILAIVMQFGMPAALMKYGSSRKDPARECGVALFVLSVLSGVVLSITWLLRERLMVRFDLSQTDIYWILGYALLFTYYMLFTTMYQVYGEFKLRGIVELCFSVALLPGLLIGHWLFHGNYETMLTAYTVSFAALIPFMLWRFRKTLNRQSLRGETLRRMSHYGFIAMLSNSGFIMVMLVQPLQIERSLGEGELGVFRVYCNGSINLAAFITGVFYAVFFPRVSASKDKSQIWRRALNAWKRACMPLFLLFSALTFATVWLSGTDEYPLSTVYVLLAALASLLITIQATFGQMVGSQGVVGATWGVALSTIFGIVNIVLTYLLLPRMGLHGAFVALAITYGLNLVATLSLRYVLDIREKELAES